MTESALVPDEAGNQGLSPLISYVLARMGTVSPALPDEESFGCERHRAT